MLLFKGICYYVIVVKGVFVKSGENLDWDCVSGREGLRKVLEADNLSGTTQICPKWRKHI